MNKLRIFIVFVILAVLSSIANVRPAAATTATGPMTLARYIHTATLLPNGKVLVAGGESGNGYLTSAELYDPATGTWTATGSMTTARSYHTATLLSDGKVLVAGGRNSGALASAELYDPATGTWSATGSMTMAHYGHTATLLLNGKVLVAGGQQSGSSWLARADLYDPATGSWTAIGSMNTARVGHTATLLPDGKVLVAGGYSGSSFLASAELYDPATSNWSPAGTMTAARSYHTTNLLPDGKVLVAGGYSGSNIASAEMYDPATGFWTATNSMTAARYAHSATLLPDGKVLVAGGNGNTGNLASAERYDPATGTWSATSSMTTARYYHTATLLPNGKVLSAGGQSGGVFLASAELYDPARSNWFATSSMTAARYHHTATLLPDGKVLVAGGHSGSGALASPQLYDPATGTWSAAGPMTAARYLHTATLLPDGKVLVTGGWNTGYLASAELYDPVTGTWSGTGSMNGAHYGHTATLLPDGRVLVAGGTSSSGYLTSAELYDPATGTWTLTGSMTEAHYAHTATLLPNGKVLVVGGLSSTSTLASVEELYDPATGTWSLTGPMTTARYGHTATLLPDGKVLIAGGWNSGSVASAELYDPATGNWSPASSMMTARYYHTATLLPAGKVLVTGGQFGSSALASAELYDPAMGNWSAISSMTTSRYAHAATLFSDGKVLVTGGLSGSSSLASAELYGTAPSRTDQAISVTTSAPTSASAGATFTVAATASSGLPVSYSSSGSCMNSGADFTMTSGSGTCLVIYNQMGDPSFNPAPQVTETVTAISATLIVNTTADTNDGTCDGHCSLREAIADASSGDNIIFDSSLSGGTIYLTSELILDKNLTIDGSTLASQITISGDTDNNGTGDVRVFLVNSGVTATLNNLTITKGNNVALGGGIHNAGTLTIVNSTLSDNSATQQGGGIYNLGMLTVTSSTFSGNSSQVNGGGIRSESVLTVMNSTFSGNNATNFNGGGISSLGMLTVTNSTFSGNRAGGVGGGIRNVAGGTATLRNTIVSDSLSGGDCSNSGTIIDGGNNIVEDNTCGFSVGNDPNLGPLQDNGGLTQTMALEVGSPAIDAGNNATCAAADQRGVTRPLDGDNNGSAICDIGAYEYEFVNFAPVITESDPQTVTMSVEGSPIPFDLTLHATDPNGDTLTWSISSPASHGTAIASGIGLSKAIGYTALSDYSGTDSFDVQVSDGALIDTITVNVNIEDRWVVTGSMAESRSQHTATLLLDGKVLVVGGYKNDFLASAELYDPATGAWTTTGALAHARYQHTATLLPDGKVLVAGGYGPGGTRASAELYDPATGIWTTTGPMAVARQAHTATLLPSGKVLVAGGYNNTDLASAELYDPTTGIWTTTSAMAVARQAHTATLLPNGKVLVAGGYGNGFLDSAELYDPATGSWTATGVMVTPRSYHTDTLLPNGKVLVAGGYNNGTFANVELYDPATGTWTTTSAMTVARYVHTATLLPNGKVLVAGGYGTSTPNASSELFDAAAGSWTTTSALTIARGVHTATLLPNGQLLVAGGQGNSGILSSAELYGVAPARTDQTISVATSAPANASVGATFTVAATATSGLSVSYSSSGSCTNTGADFTITSGTGDCTVKYDQAGNWQYNPAPQVTEIVVDANDLPMITEGASVAVTMSQDGNPTPFTLILHATDADSGDILTWSISLPASHGTAAVSGTGLSKALSYTPTADYSGVDSFDVQVSDGALTDTITVNVTIEDGWVVTGSMVQIRGHHTATLLSNGRVLVVGGLSNSDYLASAELYDPATGAWTVTGSMATARYLHTATLLPNGKVLVAGGYNGVSVIASAELYDPATGTWTATGPMAAARQGHTATLLPNGKVLVAGGTDESGYLASAELYDPATGTWTTTGSMAQARHAHTAALLPNGKVLVAGGYKNGALASAELYDPTTGTWTTTGGLAIARSYHTATLLPKGKVLVTGGFNGGPLSSAELYDPVTGTWATTGSMAKVRWAHTTTLLPNGKVLVAGGLNNDFLSSAELFDPAAGFWTSTSATTVARYIHTATLLSNGQVLVAGGDNGGYLASAELYGIAPARTDQTISVTTSSPANASAGSTFTVAATATSGLPVSYSSSGSCTNIGADFTITSGTGSCLVIYDQMGNASYNPAPTVTEIVLINAAPVIIEGASVNATMSEDGSPIGFGLTLHATDADGDTLTWSISTPAGNGTATASGTGLSKVIGYTPITDYSGTDSFDVQVSDGSGGIDTITVNVTIRPVLIVTADPQIITYGAAEPSFSFAYNGFAGSDGSSNVDTPPTCVATGTHPRNVGSYTITCSGGVDDTYDFTYVDGTLTVTKAILTVTGDDKSIVYGDPEPTFTLQYTGFVGGDTFADLDTEPTCGVAGAPSDVGTYTITCSDGLDNNYNFSYLDGTLTIAPKPITVIADPQSKAYGTVDPALTYQVTSGALVSGDSFTGALTRVSGENVGVYAITQGTLTAGSNYNLTYIGDDLTITAKPITVTAAPQTKIYGNPDPTLNYSSTPALISGDSFSGNLSRAPGENVGVYAITQGTLTAGSNYNLTYVGSNLTITAKPITVTANVNQSKVYGSADPVLSYTSTPALVSGDNFSGLLTRAVGENVGTYPITQGTLSAGSNYNLTYIANNFTITAKPITVTANAQSKAYGDPDPTLSYISTPALVSGDSFSGVLSRAPGENVGVYAITQGTLTAGSNYNLTYVPANLTITTPADLIFMNGFESGNLSTWSASVTDLGDLSVTSVAALVESFGMQAVIDDNASIYLTDNTPNAEPRYRARFYFDPNSIAMSNGNAHYIFYGNSGATQVLRIEFQCTTAACPGSGVYQVRAELRNDANGWTTSNWITISDAAHFIEVDWRAATAAGANNGGLTFWIDGVQQANLTAVDNDTRRIDSVQVGAVAGVDNGTRGTYYFDAFQSRTQTYIGGDPNVPPPPPLPDLIFADGVESGNLSAWSVTSDPLDATDPGANAAAALVGSFGLRINVNNNNSVYLTDNTPNAEARYRARFYFDPNSIPMGNNNAHYLFYGNSGVVQVIRLEFRRSAGVYQLRAELRNDANAWTTSNWFTITDALHSIEMDWRAATAVGANDGGLTFWIDGVQQADLIGVDNDTRRIDSAQLGAIAGIDNGTRGIYYFDAFESRRQTYIGP